MLTGQGSRIAWIVVAVLVSITMVMSVIFVSITMVIYY